jgi:hypothetical protein
MNLQIIHLDKTASTVTLNVKGKAHVLKGQTGGSSTSFTVGTPGLASLNTTQQRGTSIGVVASSRSDPGRARSTRTAAAHGEGSF